VTQLRKAFDKAIAASRRREWIYGRLGRSNSDGSFTVIVPARPNFVYVRLSAQGEVQSLSIAKNLNKVPAQPNLPVRMRREHGALVIIDVDPVHYEAATASQAINPYGVNAHTHARGTGLDYVVEAQRLGPGLVQWDTGLTVSVEAFRYNVGAGWATFLGDTLDLTANVPTTVDMHRWVLVALNTATNTLTTVNGDLEATSTPLTLDMLDDLNVTGLIPLGAIQVAFGDLTLNDYTKFFDARGWLNNSFDAVGGSFWHTHRMSVDTGTRTIPAGYSLIVPQFEVPAGTILEIEAGGILMVIG
jgi:hypothetical protein